MTQFVDSPEPHPSFSTPPTGVSFEDVRKRWVMSRQAVLIYPIGQPISEPQYEYVLQILPSGAASNEGCKSRLRK
jgi:hypothetical protein